MLKGFWGRHKKCSFTYKIKELFWELRYAWQRAWRGYDYSDICNLNDNLKERVVVLLKEFKKDNISIFVNPCVEFRESVPDSELYLTKDQEHKLIDDIIKYFENSDTDKLLEPLYGEFNLESGFEYEPTIEQISKCSETAKENQRKGFELFLKYFDNFWF